VTVSQSANMQSRLLQPAQLSLSRSSHAATLSCIMSANSPHGLDELCYRGSRIVHPPPSPAFAPLQTPAFTTRGSQRPAATWAESWPQTRDPRGAYPPIPPSGPHLSTNQPRKSQPKPASVLSSVALCTCVPADISSLSRQHVLQRSPGHHHGVVFAQRGRRAHQLQATRPAKRLHCIAQRGVASHAAADHQAARRCGGSPRRPSRWFAPIQRALQPIHDVAHGRQLKCRGEVLAGRGAHPGSQPPAGWRGRKRQQLLNASSVPNPTRYWDDQPGVVVSVIVPQHARRRIHQPKWRTAHPPPQCDAARLF
jgi:hypothetical protein